MVIETFPPENLAAVYERFHTSGRMLPEGLSYEDSWLDESGGRVFQIMAADNLEVFDEWTPHWNDLVGFEIIK